MTHKDDLKHGMQLLTAIERIIADTDDLISLVEGIEEGKREKFSSQAELREAIAQEIITLFSNRSAMAGGASAAPALIPIFGSAVAFVGGTLADLALMLKFEVEMAMCLSWLHGFDIREERERQLAYLLASVNTYEAKSRGSLVRDIAEVEATAIWNYTPRQLTKAVLVVLTRLALRSVSKSLYRVVPVAGIAIGAAVNKVLTSRVGRRCHAELALRREQREEESEAGPVVKAKVKRTRTAADTNGVREGGVAVNLAEKAPVKAAKKKAPTAKKKAGTKAAAKKAPTAKRKAGTKAAAKKAPAAKKKAGTKAAAKKAPTAKKKAGTKAAAKKAGAGKKGRKNES